MRAKNMDAGGAKPPFSREHARLNEQAEAALPETAVARPRGGSMLPNPALHTKPSLRKRITADRPTQIGLIALCLAAGLIAFDLRASVMPSALMSDGTVTDKKQITTDTTAQYEPQASASQQQAPLHLSISQEASVQTAALTTQVTLAAQPEPAPAPPQIITNEHKIGSGDTLSVALQKLGVPGDQAFEAINALSKHFNPRRLKVGQTLRADFKPDAHGAPAMLETLSLAIDRERTALIERNDDGKFNGKLEQLELTGHPARAAGTIASSLYVAMDKADVPHSVIVELIRIFSFDVDFQREIRQGDRFDVLYEEKRAPDGTMIRTGEVAYGALTLRGKTIGLYRHQDKAGFVDYYKADGSSAKKLLMRTPIDGARISSRYGKRRHPVLGYTKMHKGVDFAAARGTPIMAAGDGTVEYAARYGSFGNYVRIRHNGSYKTAYAHMKGFGRGIRKGKRVRQGQIIGYVGTTGRSTGPHLHYEVMKDGRQTNPLSLKLPTGKTLKGTELANFKNGRIKIDNALAEIAPRGAMDVASAE